MYILNRLSLDGYPTLAEIVRRFDEYLASEFPDFFGANPTHPCLPLKRHKVLHDNLWGTNRFSWAEWLIIDSPIFQRLSDIHQVGLAFHVYPSAHHKRFEHSLGVLILASRTYDACLLRNRGDLLDIARVAASDANLEETLKRWRQELRLGALLHDTGHSLFSHASERVYRRLGALEKASDELTQIAGKAKGAGEVFSFCLAQTNAIQSLLERGSQQLVGPNREDDYTGPIDLANVALIIVGRSAHPFLQFLGDIVSSAFDADKLDYLLRDATAAGLPLRYDLDRYLFGVNLFRDSLADGEGHLEKLYQATKASGTRRNTIGQRFPYYETYRLRIPKTALNAIEQIVICKMMLFSYLYHHAKVRASEGLFERMLSRAQATWQSEGMDDLKILLTYLQLSDSSLRSDVFLKSTDSVVRDYAYRLINRLIPREVLRINSGVATHAEAALLTDFLTDLQNHDKRPDLVARFDEIVGEELARLKPELGTSGPAALAAAGVWLDVPTAPKFKDIDELTIDSTGSSVAFGQIFPVDIWTQAYTAYSYNVRVFAFSEHCGAVKDAATMALKALTTIASPDFYARVTRARPTA